MHSPEQLPVLPLQDVRSLQRGGTAVHLVPSLRAAIPESTPDIAQLVALRQGMQQQLLVVVADASDQPTDVQLGTLQRDEMQLDSEDARTLEVCDRNIAALRARIDAVLPRLLDSAAIARRTAALGQPDEEDSRALALEQLKTLEQNLVALRLQWEGSLYHRWIRDAKHSLQHRERFRAAMQQDYDRQSQALGYIESYAMVQPDATGNS